MKIYENRDSQFLYNSIEINEYISKKKKKKKNSYIKYL